MGAQRLRLSQELDAEGPPERPLCVPAARVTGRLGPPAVRRTTSRHRPLPPAPDTHGFHTTIGSPGAITRARQAAGGHLWPSTMGESTQPHPRALVPPVSSLWHLASLKPELRDVWPRLSSARVPG